MSEDPNDSDTVTGKNPSFRRLERLFENSVVETFFAAIVLTFTGIIPDRNLCPNSKLE